MHFSSHGHARMCSGKYTQLHSCSLSPSYNRPTHIAVPQVQPTPQTHTHTSPTLAIMKTATTCVSCGALPVISKETFPLMCSLSSVKHNASGIFMQSRQMAFQESLPSVCVCVCACVCFCEQVSIFGVLEHVHLCFCVCAFVSRCAPAHVCHPRYLIHHPIIDVSDQRSV